jgi:Putative Ig domain
LAGFRSFGHQLVGNNANLYGGITITVQQVCDGFKVMQRTLILILQVGILAVSASSCGGGASGLPTLSMATNSLADGIAQFAYSQVILAKGGVGPFTWSISSGSLPHNLTLKGTSNSATISGTPDTPQNAVMFAVQVRDAKNQSAAKSYTINISNPASAQLQQVQGQAPAGTIEVKGLSAGSFNPTYWQQNTLNWVPDVREPMFTALTTSPYQNIYAPWPLEQPAGWRLFYGGWDGSDTPNDRVYSVTTTDFLTFDNRQLVIDHGALQHVNNVNVHQIPDGSLHMVCTGGAYDGTNWPTYFSSPDGVTWNGSAEPYQAQTADVVEIQGYSNYQYGGFNGGNVLFWDNSWTLYFYDNNNNGQIFRATGASPHIVQLQGIALATGADPNGVNKFMANGQPWYLMTLMSNGPQLWYSLSNDGLKFGPMNNLIASISSLDTAMDSLAFVTKGNQLLGTIYGANSGSPETQFTDNAIFARWLQKKVVITDSSGAQYFAQGSYGPDRQWFQMPDSGSLQAEILIYAEDGVTPLAAGAVNLNAGTAYQLVINSNKSKRAK